MCRGRFAYRLINLVSIMKINAPSRVMAVPKVGSTIKPINPKNSTSMESATIK